MDDDYGMSPQQLFEKYIVSGPAQWVSTPFAMRVDSIDKESMTVEGTVTATNSAPCWFHVGERVTVRHLHDEVWRMTSEADDHGQAVFLGADYGGIGIGS